MAVAAVRAGWADGDGWLDRDADEDGVVLGPYLWHWDPIDDLLDRLAPADRPAVVGALLASTHPGVRAKALDSGVAPAAPAAPVQIGDPRRAGEPAEGVQQPE
ncbi:hypothetical protein O7626_18365 [Micromonospora sp. WMMD1102]|uniref:hypothetical protein n=1 Tax=Micromonospora sp. WMMD1102 TaxID=3016105 RepID=UPI00241581A4|nr:hypothetical protein [Micromonospora sp. WMMD1102]MDG4787880.1 hypothetical protein [Micromonospora sp. WMMD1102]